MAGCTAATLCVPVQFDMSNDWCCGLTAMATRLTKNQNVGCCRGDFEWGLMEGHSCVDGWADCGMCSSMAPASARACAA